MGLNKLYSACVTEESLSVTSEDVYSVPKSMVKLVCRKVTIQFCAFSEWYDRFNWT